MKTSAIALTMPMSSFANDAAWFLLKQSKDDYDLTRLMSEEDQQAAARHSASLSPEKQDAMRQISETFNAMPDEAKGQLTASAHNLMRQYEGRLGEVLPQEGHESGAVTKFFPLVIGVVFALDALNRSQGAKASLVGNVFTDIGNGVSTAVGGQSDMFGESDYGDIAEWDNQSSLVNPLTGTQHAVVDDPSLWQRTWMGAASAVGSFVNPFAAVGAAGKGASRLGGKPVASAIRGAGRTQQATGRGISRLGARGTQRAGDKAVGELGDMGASFGARASEASARAGAVGRLDRFGRKVTAGGTGKINAANATQASKVAASKTANQLENLAGGSRGMYGMPYRALQGSMQAGLPGVIAGAAATWAQNQFGGGGGGGGGPNQISGGTTGYGTGFGGAGGGVNDISNVQGNALGNKQIWDPDAYSGNKQVQQFENQGEFGGFGTTQKGDNMFVNNKGNEIKKEVTDLMYKAVCPKCDKKDCKCDEYNKADSDKKPAHGMVIVIGSKAGPGPSKDGKREKLDSEKKEE